MQNFTTYAHYTEKQLVSKKSEDNQSDFFWKSHKCEKSLSSKGFFLFSKSGFWTIIQKFPQIVLDFLNLTIKVVKRVENSREKLTTKVIRKIPKC
ncbi:hypothetical protein CUN31_01700 [Enterococcus faecalis]|nr:hypothetical protein CUN31_01700 [Enterococcus faecalis]